MRLSPLMIILSCCALHVLSAQDYYEDFESYEVGDFLAEESDAWVTIDGNPGGPDDVQIVDDYSFSGTQSIRIIGDAMGFGHDNLFLSFGGLKTEGYLEFKMRIFIPDTSSDSNGARFYLVSNEGMSFIPGIVCHLKEEINVSVHEGNGPINVISKPSVIGEWIEVGFTVNLDQNAWSVYLDNDCIGTFSNPNNKIHGLRILPFMWEIFYIDDVSYRYDSIAPPDELAVEMTQLRWYGSKMAGTDSDIRIGFRNVRDEIIQDAVIGLTFDGDTFLDTLTGMNIKKGEEYHYDFPKKFSPPSGIVIIKARLHSVNGDAIHFECGRMKEQRIEMIKPTSDRSVGFVRSKAFSEGQIGFLDGFPIWPDPVPPDRMTFYNIARVWLFDYTDQFGYMVSNTELGDKQMTNFSWEVPEHTEDDNLDIISAFTNGDFHSEVMNAESVSLEEALVHGLEPHNQKESEQTLLKVYPNPVADRLNVKFHSKCAERVRIELIKSNGRLAHERDIKMDPGQQVFRMDLRSFQSGVYFLRFNTDESVWQEKVIVTAP